MVDEVWPTLLGHDRHFVIIALYYNSIQMREVYFTHAAIIGLSSLRDSNLRRPLNFISIFIVGFGQSFSKIMQILICPNSL